METYKTDQEEFWAGSFGNEYADRNAGVDWIATNTAFFSRILRNTTNIKSVIEFGSNIGLNLQAIHNLLPHVSLSAVEINDKAVETLKTLNIIKNFKYH